MLYICTGDSSIVYLTAAGYNKGYYETYNSAPGRNVPAGNKKFGNTIEVGSGRCSYTKKSDGTKKIVVLRIYFQLELDFKISRGGCFCERLR